METTNKWSVRDVITLVLMTVLLVVSSTTLYLTMSQSRAL